MIYEPSEDSFLLKRVVEKYAVGKKVLDIGCGSGILSLASLKSGAKSVIGVDCDIDAVNLCKKKGINVILSDLFSNITGNYDLIVFNPPYLPKDDREDFESARVTTGGKKGDEIILRFLKKANNYLEKDGVILLLISSLTPLTRIKKVLEEKRMKYKIIDSKKLFMERLEVWEVKRFGIKMDKLKRLK